MKLCPQCSNKNQQLKPQNMARHHVLYGLLVTGCTTHQEKNNERRIASGFYWIVCLP